MFEKTVDKALPSVSAALRLTLGNAAADLTLRLFREASPGSQSRASGVVHVTLPRRGLGSRNPSVRSRKSEAQVHVAASFLPRRHRRWPRLPRWRLPRPPPPRLGALATRGFHAALSPGRWRCVACLPAVLGRVPQSFVALLQSPSLLGGFGQRLQLRMLRQPT